jgi:hypothetical protein
MPAVLSVWTVWYLRCETFIFSFSFRNCFYFLLDEPNIVFLLVLPDFICHCQNSLLITKFVLRGKPTKTCHSIKTGFALHIGHTDMQQINILIDERALPEMRSCYNLGNEEAEVV